MDWMNRAGGRLVAEPESESTDDRSQITQRWMPVHRKSESSASDYHRYGVPGGSSQSRSAAESVTMSGYQSTITPLSFRMRGENLSDVMGLEVIYEPEVSPLIDIVLVHSIGGGSRSTWCVYCGQDHISYLSPTS